MWHVEELGEYGLEIKAWTPHPTLPLLERPHYGDGPAPFPDGGDPRLTTVGTAFTIERATVEEAFAGPRAPRTEQIKHCWDDLAVARAQTHDLQMQPDVTRKRRRQVTGRTAAVDVHVVSTRAVYDLVVALGGTGSPSPRCLGSAPVWTRSSTPFAPAPSRTPRSRTCPWPLPACTRGHPRRAGGLQAVVVAIGVTADGGREVFGLDVGRHRGRDVLARLPDRSAGRGRVGARLSSPTSTPASSRSYAGASRALHTNAAAR